MHATLAQIDPYTLTGGRFWSLAAALLAILGTIGGALAFRHRRWALPAAGLGTAAAATGVIVVASAEGGPGTGGGIVGGYLSTTLGVVAVVLAVLARYRAQ